MSAEGRFNYSEIGDKDCGCKVRSGGAVAGASTIGVSTCLSNSDRLGSRDCSAAPRHTTTVYERMRIMSAEGRFNHREIGDKGLWL